jgi:hypothetical protein
MSSPEAVSDAPALLCPACGFDLRAATTDRCSVCGLVIDRDTLRESGLPWAHRRRFGRVRAFASTVLDVTLDRRAIRHEFAKPQELADAAAFRRINTLIVAAALFALFAFVVFGAAGHGFADLTIQPIPAFTFGRAAQPFDGWVLDLAVPWFAGATLVPVLPVCLVLLAARLTGLQRHVIRLPDASPDQRRRALALAHYAAAPLTLLLPGFLTVIGAAWALPHSRRLGVALGFVGVPLVLAAFGVTLWRTGQWLDRTRHCGLGRALLAALELLALWIVGAIVLLGLLPWCVGFLCLVFDSLR